MKQAVIFVPGIMGSELWQGNDLIWPGRPIDLIRRYPHMKQLLDPSTRVGDIIRKVSISTQYGDLVEALSRCGFVEGDKSSPLKVFPYDWRKDNVIASRQLADVIDGLHTELNGDCEITLLAHSMGGLVSRSYLESGYFSLRPGFAAVKRLITLGTPHRGAPMALSAALGEERRAFLSASQVMEISRDANFPSLYQLLPPEGEAFVWDRSTSERYSPLNIYDESLSGALALKRSNLDAARHFHATIDLGRRPTGVRYFFFAGTQETTTTAVQIFGGSSEPLKGLHKLDRRCGGDGTVPVWSALMTGVQCEQVSGEHGTIYKSRDVKRVLGVLLDRPGVLATSDEALELWLSDPVVEASGRVNLTISLPRGTTGVEGDLSIARASDTSRSLTTLRVMYTGPMVDQLSLVLDAPDYPGEYLIDFHSREAKLVEQAALFVQSP